MERHAAWFLPGRQMPPEIAARYDLIYSWAPPRETLPGTTLLLELCVQDAFYPATLTDCPVHRTWALWCQANNVWAHDASGNKLPGWGGTRLGRFATDLSLPAPWADGVAMALRTAQGIGMHGLEMDDLGVRPYLIDSPSRGLAAWERSAQEMAVAVNTTHAPNSVNGYYKYYCPEPMRRRFPIIKAEDSHHARPITLKDWIEGDDRSIGILAMDQLGQAVTWEKLVPNDWTKEQIDSWGETMLATMMLTDHGRVMIHAFNADQIGPPAYPGPGTRTPIWCPSFDLSERVGGPLQPAHRGWKGVWRRQYAHGVVGVNPTDQPRTCAGIGTVAPGTGRVVVE